MKSKYPKFFKINTKRLYWAQSTECLIAEKPDELGRGHVYLISDMGNAKLKDETWWFESTIRDWIKDKKCEKITKYEAALL